jgi:hypothetical protein
MGALGLIFIEQTASDDSWEDKIDIFYL